jgi:hypothetical protein
LIGEEKAINCKSDDRVKDNLFSWISLPANEMRKPQIYYFLTCTFENNKASEI